MTTAVRTYEQRLFANPDWALREGSMHFEGESGVQRTLRVIAERLDTLGVPYAVCGGMALFQHGYRRFTEDVDLLVTRESLQLIHEKLDGLGYIPPFQARKAFTDFCDCLTVIHLACSPCFALPIG